MSEVFSRWQKIFVHVGLSNDFLDYKLLSANHPTHSPFHSKYVYVRKDATSHTASNFVNMIRTQSWTRTVSNCWYLQAVWNEKLEGCTNYLAGYEEFELDIFIIPAPMLEQSLAIWK